MSTDRRRVRGLLLAVFVPVVIVIGVLATAVLGQNDTSADRIALPRPALPVPGPEAPPPPPAEVAPPVAPARRTRPGRS
jgi:hypothetical protein